MAAETGHHPSRAYIDQSGDLHLNGGKFFNDAEEDMAPGLEAVGGLTEADLEVLSGSVVNVTAATLSVTKAAHHHRMVTLNRAAGIAVTLPAATGSGTRYEFVIGTTITSNTTTIKVTGDDVMAGHCLQSPDTVDAANIFPTAADSDTITLNGSTTGGFKGDRIVLIDVALDLWSVFVVEEATGAEATPFSATV